jgi:trimeric autotransporter adhesin
MKKISLIAAACMLLGLFAQSQNLGINSDGSKPDRNAILDVKSTTKGVLFPRMSSAQRLAIPATTGMMVYDVTTKSFWYNNGSEWKSMGASALAATGAWDLNGNAGTDNNNFLGTTDNAQLWIRVNNVNSGRIDHIQFNTFWGYGSGYSNFFGQYNTGVGYEALHLVNHGYSNTAVGRFALRNTNQGHSNTAIGMDAMLENTNGARNTAVGMLSLLSNTTGLENVAVGYDALRSNTEGGGNVAVGAAALHNNTSGTSNTVVGASALYANTQGTDNTVVGSNAYTTGRGSYNTIMGSHTMRFGNTGSYNVCIGEGSMYYNQAGSYNVAVGSGAYGNASDGTYNTVIGTQATVEYGATTNATAIGYGAHSDASNKVRIGNSAVTVIEGQVPFTTPSDGRFKFNIEEDVKGIDFIMQLRPVTYQFDVKRFDGKTAENASMQSAYNEAEKIRRTGFIAQEVEKAAIATGYNFSGVIKPKKDGDHYSLSYDAFVVPLVKAVQELNSKVQTLEKENETLREQIKMIEELRKKVDRLMGSK